MAISTIPTRLKRRKRRYGRKSIRKIWVFVINGLVQTWILRCEMLSVVRSVSYTLFPVKLDEAISSYLGIQDNHVSRECLSSCDVDEEGTVPISEGHRNVPSSSLGVIAPSTSR